MAYTRWRTKLKGLSHIAALGLIILSCGATRSEAAYISPVAASVFAARTQDRRLPPKPDTGQRRGAAEPFLSVDGAATPTIVEPIHVTTETRSYRHYAAAAPVIRISDRIPANARKILSRGIPAEISIVERITKWNDAVVDRQIVSHRSTRAARPGVVLAGLSHAVASSIMTLVATAYTAISAGSSNTANGMRAIRGVVAVDPKLIPLGTHLYIPGYGHAIAADTGSAIYGHRIDLCMNSQGEALNFGRQTVKVYVLGR